MWDLTRHALEFFQLYLPFHEMNSQNGLISGGTADCLAKPGEVYALYLPNGGTAQLDLGTSTNDFAIEWYNPRQGGPLQPGTVALVSGPGSRSIGLAPTDTGLDWAVRVSKVTDPPPPDRDNDGLPDDVETNTGVFVGPQDTGTDPDNPDTDGDGVNDELEVHSGTNPLDENDTPDLPSTIHLGRLLLGKAILMLGMVVALRKSPPERAGV